MTHEIFERVPSEKLTDEGWVGSFSAKLTSGRLSVEVTHIYGYPRFFVTQLQFFYDKTELVSDEYAIVLEGHKDPLSVAHCIAQLTPEEVMELIFAAREQAVEDGKQAKLSEMRVVLGLEP